MSNHLYCQEEAASRRRQRGKREGGKKERKRGRISKRIDLFVAGTLEKEGPSRPPGGEKHSAEGGGGGR